METIRLVLDTFKKYYYIVVAALIVLCYFIYKEAYQDSLVYKQNVSALQDSVRLSKTKVGALEYSRGLLIADIGELKTLSNDLYNLSNELKGDVKYLSQIKSKIMIVRDTVRVTDKVFLNPDGSSSLVFSFNKIDSGLVRSLEGFSLVYYDSIDSKIKSLGTYITKDQLDLTISTGFRDMGGYYESFVTSKYPGYVVTELNSAVLDKKMLKIDPSRWSVALVASVGYGVKLNDFEVVTKPQAFIGIGVSYRIFEF